MEAPGHGGAGGSVLGEIRGDGDGEGGRGGCGEAAREYRADVGGTGFLAAWRVTDAGLNPGETVAGSDLRYANDGGNGGEAGRSTTALSGTWRLMGSLGWRLGVSGWTGSQSSHKTSLWLRIA
jgi:hypothetical protein